MTSPPNPLERRWNVAGNPRGVPEVSARRPGDVPRVCVCTGAALLRLGDRSARGAHVRARRAWVTTPVAPDADAGRCHIGHERRRRGSRRELRLVEGWLGRFALRRMVGTG